MLILYIYGHFSQKVKYTYFNHRNVNMKKRSKFHKSLELGEMKEVVEFVLSHFADGDSEAIQKEEICLKSHNEFVAELSLKSFFPGI